MLEKIPFTSYDFYGYLACGLLMIFAVDYLYFDSYLMTKSEWSFVQSAFIISLAYIVGQVIATPSSLLLEHFLARTLLKPPVSVLISDTTTAIECFINKYLVGRNYAPLPEALRSNVIKKAMEHTSLTKQQLLDKPEEIFQLAYSKARNDSDTNKRLDDFCNQYGFNRNIAFSGILITILMITKIVSKTGSFDYLWLVFTVAITFGMLVRFFKFYCCYSAEVLRAFAYKIN